MRLIKLLVLFALLSASSTFAGELDTYYLQQFGELATGSSGTVLKSAQTATVQKCGMPLRHNLKRDWKQLETSTQKTLEKYLAKPTLAGEKIVTTNGGHFRIHYASTGSDAPPLADIDSNGIPDWVETVADVFEAVYDREITKLNYRIPPNMPYDVYLRSLINYLGLTTSDTITGLSATSFIEIDKDFQTFSISGIYTPLGLLKVTAAHEFHHAIQYGYNYYFQAWYAEATSSWMEDEVYDSVNQLYDYVPDYFSTSPGAALPNTVSALDLSDGYSRWIFNRYLYEQYYPQDMIRTIWETFANEQPTSGADIPMLNFIDTKVLKAGSGSLASSFFGFAKQAYLRNWKSHTNEISNIHPVPTVAVAADSAYTLASPSLPAYSFVYYKFNHTTSTTSKLTISYPSKPVNYAVVAIKDSDSSEYAYDPASQSVTIPSFKPTDSIYLLVCNNVTGTTTITPTPQTATIPSPQDTTNPYSTKPTPTPTPAAGGGGGGCFIATAAYGSYLHPEVMTLRNFRDRYLLTNIPGRAFVALYYRVSPPIADFVRDHESARFIVRLFLAPVIFAVKHLWLAAAAAVMLASIAFVKGWRLLSDKFILAKGAR